MTVFGGVSQKPQVAALRRGVDIVVACPGRLEDLIAQRHCSLGAVEITVLDEADHMADLGFLPAVRRLLGATPTGGQRLLFSATLDNAIDSLVRQFLHKPAVHEADSAQSPVGTMTHHVLQVERENRVPVLVALTSAPGRTVVFTRTKYGARALARQLTRAGVPAVDLHGDLSQNARDRNLEAFHSGRAETLVATDIAARGIHVDDVALVVHADPPAEHKAYLHRSGRTARAGNSGTVITLAAHAQQRDVAQLMKAAAIKAAITRVDSADHPVLAELAPGERTLVAAAPVTTAPRSSTSSTLAAPARPSDDRRGNASSRGRRRGRRPVERVRSTTGGRSGQQQSNGGGSASGSKPARSGGRGRTPSRGSSHSPSHGSSHSPSHSAASFSARSR